MFSVTANAKVSWWLRVGTSCTTKSPPCRIFSFLLSHLKKNDDELRDMLPSDVYRYRTERTEFLGVKLDVLGAFY